MLLGHWFQRAPAMTADTGAGQTKATSSLTIPLFETQLSPNAKDIFTVRFLDFLIKFNIIYLFNFLFL